MSSLTEFNEPNEEISPDGQDRIQIEVVRGTQGAGAEGTVATAGPALRPGADRSLAPARSRYRGDRFACSRE